MLTLQEIAREVTPTLSDLSSVPGNCNSVNEADGEKMASAEVQLQSLGSGNPWRLRVALGATLKRHGLLTGTDRKSCSRCQRELRFEMQQNSKQTTIHGHFRSK